MLLTKQALEKRTVSYQRIEQRSSHSFFLLDWFWFSTSLLWDTLAFISSKPERWVQYFYVFLNKENQSSTVAVSVFLCFATLTICPTPCRPIEHRKEIWILKPGLFTFVLFQTARKVTKQQQSSNVALICVKMASVMGVTWILGIAANLKALSFLWYPYVVLNSLQGKCPSA